MPVNHPKLFWFQMQLLEQDAPPEPADGIPYLPWTRQTQLPLRLGGMGLRSATRTSHAAYWASWADCLHPLLTRYPAFGDQVLTCLQQEAADRPANIVEAEMAARVLDDAGFRADRPRWDVLARSARPQQPDAADVLVDQIVFLKKYAQTSLKF